MYISASDPIITAKARLKFRRLFPVILDSIILLGTSLLFLSTLRVGFQNYIDDQNYIVAAQGWLHEFPFIGTNHWQNRHPLVLGIAVSFKLFGENDSALAIPATLSYLLVIGITYSFIGKIADRSAALLAGILMASIPLLAFMAGTAYPDMIEMVFIVASLTLFLSIIYQKNKPSIAKLLLIGILLGLAFLTRQFALGMMFFLAILFFTGYGLARKNYVWIIAGFILIITVECGYFWYYTGDPLHRYYIDLHPSVKFEDVAAHFKDKAAAKIAASGFPFFNTRLMAQWLPASLVSIHWIVDPYLGFLTEGNYGFLFWFAIPCTLWVCLSKNCPVGTQKIARLLVLFCVLWFFTIVYFLSLRAQSRYFMPIVFVAVIHTALAFRYWGWRKHKIATISIITFLLVTNWLWLDLKPVPQYVAHQFYDFVRNSNEIVYAEPGLLKEANFYLKADHLQDRVKSLPAPTGALQFLVLEDRAQPVDSKTVVYTITPAREPILTQMLSYTPLLERLPEKLKMFLRRPYPPMIVIRQP